MFQESQICPYTGLRSFTEEESLYFKGREDDIDQATAQLQRNKFLMLTGASGDGKSSLVYAGIIPNARAGFLKAKYSQWCVADFRPERSPFHNLSRAVAKQLDIENTETVEAELRYGFSALVDLYTNSKRFVDTESVQWQQADDKQKAAIKREAANLIILVDQFEEFFTNPENYTHGVPSTDSNIVLNLLLETARIALEQDLPIYVIFTMRSDYIGQCAAFRELPEYIGFSQFFVPRLNRAQLQQIIEEPAVLSGNRISRRLTERLIHDIAEGVDQLPIIQHALNQIWHAADNGQDEMDLIHYAMTGGMPEAELPDEQRKIFSAWFDKLTDKIKACYQEPNLQNVLDTHANKLFESASEEYRSATGKSITDAQAKSIIKTTFTCLTKIDQSRAVRNRMSLKEITLIINSPDVNTETVAGVLRIFREPGNTFIRPFINEDDSSIKLEGDDVLDITHESLIRNWEFLEEWAKEEFDNYTISLDFKRQLDRWVESEKSNGFLLSIGPLTYFESWYNKVKPNAWWIARYLPEDADQGRFEHSKKILENGREFLNRSASRHAVTRVVMRYGPKRIAAVFVLLMVAALAVVGVRKYLRQRDAYVFNTIKEQAVRIAKNNSVDFYSRSILLAQLIKADKLSIGELAEGDQPLKKLNTISGLAAVLIFQGGAEPAREIRKSFAAIDSILYSIRIEDLSAEELNTLVVTTDYIVGTQDMVLVSSNDPDLKKFRQRTADFAGKLAVYIFRTQPAGFTQINGLHLCLEHAINYRSLSKDDLAFVHQTISPFTNEKHSEWILQNYNFQKIAIRGNYDYGFRSNGMYQETAYLAAASGNVQEALQCVDTLIKYNQNYFQLDYANNIDNAANIAAYFYRYGNIDQLNAFATGYAKRRKVTEVEFYQRLIGRSTPGDYISGRLNANEPTISNPNLLTGGPEQQAFFFSRLRASIQNSNATADEINFDMARSYKDEAILRSFLALMKGDKSPQSQDSLFDRAFTFYDKVSPTFLESYLMMATSNDIDARLAKRKRLFLFPDYRTPFSTFEGRNFHLYYTSGVFVDYILSHNKLAQYYTDADLTYFSDWVMAAHRSYSFNTNGRDLMRPAVSTTTLTNLVSALDSRKNVSRHEFSMLYLLTGNFFYRNGDRKNAYVYYSKIDYEKLPEFFLGMEEKFSVFYEMGLCFNGLLANGDWTKAKKVMHVFKNPVNRSSIYAYASLELLIKNPNDTLGGRLLDSANHELTRIENLNSGQTNRNIIAGALAYQDPDKNLPEAYKTIKNIYEKTNTTGTIARALARHGDLYGAQQQITDNVSESDLAMYLWNIVYGYAQAEPKTKPEWIEFNRNHFGFLIRPLIYQNEDN